jgi:cytochrome P450
MEETFRYHSVSNVPRNVEEEFTYEGVVFPKDMFLFFTLTLNARDPVAFADADSFNPERVHLNRHMAFGRGAHICLGQFLARAQIEEGLHLIAQRMKNPKAAGPVSWRTFIGVWGLKTLPITFEPVTAATLKPAIPLAS